MVVPPPLPAQASLLPAQASSQINHEAHKVHIRAACEELAAMQGRLRAVEVQHRDASPARTQHNKYQIDTFIQVVQNSLDAFMQQVQQALKKEQESQSQLELSIADLRRIVVEEQQPKLDALESRSMTKMLSYSDASFMVSPSESGNVSAKPSGAYTEISGMSQAAGESESPRKDLAGRSLSSTLSSTGVASQVDDILVLVRDHLHHEIKRATAPYESLVTKQSHHLEQLCGEVHHYTRNELNKLQTAMDEAKETVNELKIHASESRDHFEVPGMATPDHLFQGQVQAFQLKVQEAHDKLSKLDAEITQHRGQIEGALVGALVKDPEVMRLFEAHMANTDLLRRFDARLSKTELDMQVQGRVNTEILQHRNQMEDVLRETLKTSIPETVKTSIPETLRTCISDPEVMRQFEMHMTKTELMRQFETRIRKSEQDAQVQAQVNTEILQHRNQVEALLRETLKTSIPETVKTSVPETLRNAISDPEVMRHFEMHMMKTELMRQFEMRMRKTEQSVMCNAEIAQHRGLIEAPLRDPNSDLEVMRQFEAHMMKTELMRQFEMRMRKTEHLVADFWHATYG